MLTINEEELPKEMITMEMKEASALFTVSPNPATSAFTLEVFDFEAAQTIQVEIYSMMGERVIQTSVIGQKQYKFDVTDWPKGVYIVRVMAGNKMGVEKLIKQ
jgi:fibronectin type 3 domain-containing protein